MRIAVCIKNKKNSDLLSKLFHLYQEEKEAILFVRFYENEIELLCQLTGGEFDVIFFSDGEGEQFAKDVNAKDRQVRLVHMTSPNNTSKIVGDVWCCLPDPPNRAFLFPVLDRLLPDTSQIDEPGILVKSRGAMTSIPFSRIEYVEVLSRTVFFHLMGGITEESAGSFSDFETKLLQWPDFIKVHRAYIVNLRHIQKLDSYSIITQGGHSVPVSKHLYPQLKKDYLCRLMIPESKQESSATCSTHSENDASITYSVLLVDDEQEQRIRWSKVLNDNNCTVQTAENGESALHLASEMRFDCVVLDVKLGEQSGFELCNVLAEASSAPVVFLSSLDDGDSQAQGFLSGGINYITKDSSDRLFWLKIETRIKMARAGKAEVCDGGLRLDLKNRKVYFLSQEISLNPIEFDLLFLLIQNPSTVFTPARLYKVICGAKQLDGGQSVQLHLYRLNRKLTDACPQHSFITTVWGSGYQYSPMSIINNAT